MILFMQGPSMYDDSVRGTICYYLIFVLSGRLYMGEIFRLWDKFRA